MDAAALGLFPAPRHVAVSGPGPARVEPPAVALDAELPAQGFRLIADPSGVRIRHADDAGLRYARAALGQLRRRFGARLPGLELRDWPDFPVRGYMLDVSRDRVPTREDLALLVDRLAILRINHLQLYTEHTFAYAAHRTVWRDASPITPDDVRWLDARCRERGIELAANQNCFGHLAGWLRHDAYRWRAEAPDGWDSPFGRRRPAVLAPTDENAAFVLELVDELCACFTSRHVNIGCDETFELGHGASRDAVAKLGRGRVYLDFVLRLIRAQHARGRCVSFWGDILREHAELAPELPRVDTIALAWHYEAPHLDTPAQLVERLAGMGVGAESLRGFEPHVRPFARAQVPFWVCPGTSCWNTTTGRLPNALANLRDAAETGLAHGAGGYLITDWGDNGHMAPPSVSLPPLAYGAGLAWCLESNRDVDLAGVLDRHVFADPARELGAALIALGSVHGLAGARAFNGSALQYAALGRRGALLADPAHTVTRAGLRDTHARLDEFEERLARSRPACSDAHIIHRELAQAARLARHGTHALARWAHLPGPRESTLRSELAALIGEQRACWLQRSREGGLDHSLGLLRRTLESYSV